LTVHKRQYADGPLPSDTIIGELTDARSRRLVQKWNKPAQLTFSIDGHSPSALEVQELSTDVVAWRWDENSGQDVAMFRGAVWHSEDTLSEQSATVNFTCNDYLASLGNRFFESTFHWPGFDQDTIAAGIVTQAANMIIGGDTRTIPSGFLPMWPMLVDPGGVIRTTQSGQIYDITHVGSTFYLDALTKLALQSDATGVGGFDFDIVPFGLNGSLDAVRIFYPYQGVQRDNPALIYGSTISALTRTVSAENYCDYDRIIGKSASTTSQLSSEAWDGTLLDVNAFPQGLWMRADSAPDVDSLATLTNLAYGYLNRFLDLIPSYTVTMRPAICSPGYPNMGDVVPLIIEEGRLNVNTYLRVIGIDYEISDDGYEKISLAVGRPDITISDIFTGTKNTTDALVRRF
jgi:hypothetical protein